MTSRVSSSAPRKHPQRRPSIRLARPTSTTSTGGVAPGRIISAPWGRMARRSRRWPPLCSARPTRDTSGRARSRLRPPRPPALPPPVPRFLAPPPALPPAWPLYFLPFPPAVLYHPAAVALACHGRGQPVYERLSCHDQRDCAGL